MDTRQQQGGLDRFRMIAALLVAAIHISPLASFSADADFFLTRILARVAVPFFLMVTGEFVLSGYLTGRDRHSGKLGRYIRKVALFYGISIVIYLPIGIYAGHYQDLTLAGALKMLAFDGTFYHLWYFPACIIGVILVYLLSRVLGTKGLLAAGGILYLIGLFGDSYYGLIGKIPAAFSFYEGIFRISSYTRNGVFFGPIFLILGAIYGTKAAADDAGAHRRSAGLALSLAFMTAEAFTLRQFNLQRHDSMYLALIPTMIFLYGLLLSWNKKPDRRLRTVSTWIYILHPAMIVLTRGVAKHLGLTGLLVDNSLIHYLTVCVLSVIAAWGIALAGSLRTAGSKGSSGRFFSTPREKGAAVHTSRAWIELDRDALAHNVSALREKLPDSCRLMPAVKANAYGHGAVLMAKELDSLGVDCFCVACADEGVELRRAGIRGEILILGYTHFGQFPLLCRYRLTQTVVDYSYAVRLNRYGHKIHVHIGIDTGMHRLGERCENLDKLCRIFEMKHLIVDGLFTHLSADDTLEPQDKAFTRLQAKSFYSTVDELKQRGCPCPRLHLQSSYGILYYPELAEDYARVGIALYGVLSTKEDTETVGSFLEPVLSLKARIASVRTLYSGESAGYGLQFIASQDMRIATLAIGYADGLPRSLSNGVGSVLVNGHRAPIIGRVCMDQTIIDVSGIPNVRSGDIAVLIGKSGEEEISACDLAKQAGTISNEILSRLGARLGRVIQ